MTISLPIPLSFQSSNVVDLTETLADKIVDCSQLILEDGMEVQGDNWIWQYNGDYKMIPYFDQGIADGTTPANGKGYAVGDILMKDCKIVEITGKAGGGFSTVQRPKEPEDYSGWDVDKNGVIDFDKFSHRYFRVKASTKGGWLNKQWRSKTGRRWYYMFWEARGYGGCTDGAWRWSSKDISTFTQGQHQAYLRSCLKDGYTSKYEAGRDVRATKPNWAAPYGCRIKEPTLQFHSMIERGGYFYFRTHLKMKPETKDITVGTKFSYTYSDVLSPSQIDGFTKKRLINAHNPFDGKNYTYTEDVPPTGASIWTMLAAEPFDCMAFGRIEADSISIRVMDAEGKVIESITNYQVENEVASTSERQFPATVVLYTGRNKDGSVQLLPAESVIEVTLKGDRVKIGEIIAGEALDAGFTKTNFKNKFKDFSPKEQDQWGNWHYVDGVRVGVHSGTVEYPIVSYDELNRLMLLIGGRKVIINSSDSLLNQAPDGKHVFEATMMIARFLTFELSATEKNKRIGERGLYTFNIEELV